MMPQIEKLVPVDGRLGIVLDIPLDRFGEGSVSIYSEQEVKDLIERTKRDEREAIIERIIERIGKTGQCPETNMKGDECGTCLSLISERDLAEHFADELSCAIGRRDG